MLIGIRKAFITTTILIAIAIALSVSSWAQDRAEFSLRAIDGATVTSENLRGQVVVLAFGASWLPVTSNQMEAMKKLGDQYAGRGVATYWVSTDSENLKSKNFVADSELRGLARKYNVKVLRDPDGAISKKLSIDQLPSVVIIDKQGNISGTAGGLDPNADLARQLATRLDKIL